MRSEPGRRSTDRCYLHARRTAGPEGGNVRFCAGSAVSPVWSRRPTKGQQPVGLHDRGRPMTATVPFNDLQRHWAPLADRLEAVAKRVLRSGRYCSDPRRRRSSPSSQRSAAPRLCRRRERHRCARDRAASLGMRARRRSRGDGERRHVRDRCNPGDRRLPVFAEIDPGSLLLSSDSAAALVTPRTAAVVATHLYGNVVDVERASSRVSHRPSRSSRTRHKHTAHRSAARGLVRWVTSQHSASIPRRTLERWEMQAPSSRTGPSSSSARRHCGSTAGNPATWQRSPVGRTRASTSSKLRCSESSSRASLVGTIGAPQIRAQYVEALGDRLDFVDGRNDRTRPATHLCVARVNRTRPSEGRHGVGRSRLRGPFPRARPPTTGAQPTPLPAGRPHRDRTSLRGGPEPAVLSALRDDEVERVVESARRRT